METLVQHLLEVLLALPFVLVFVGVALAALR